MHTKTAIYYYSATGNSLSVAKQLNNSLPNSELISILRCLKDEQLVVNSSHIGLVFPVHRMGIPQLVYEFLEKVLFPESTYVFVVLTGGNPRFSAGIYQVRKLLEKRGRELSGGFHVKMPASYFSILPFNTKKHYALNVECVKKKVEAICTAVRGCELRIEKGFRVLSLLNDVRIRSHNGSAKYFSVDEGYIKCGYCIMVCPLQNIHFSGSQHIFQNNCNACMACVHYCSKQVLQYKRRSIGVPRYQNPNVSMGELMAQKR